MAVLFEGGLALLLCSRPVLIFYTKNGVYYYFSGKFMFCWPGLPVVGDVRHVALLLVAVVTLDRTVVHGLLNLGKRGEN